MIRLLPVFAGILLVFLLMRTGTDVNVLWEPEASIVTVRDIPLSVGGEVDPNIVPRGASGPVVVRGSAQFETVALPEKSYADTLEQFKQQLEQYGDDVAGTAAYLEQFLTYSGKSPIASDVKLFYAQLLKSPLMCSEADVNRSRELLTDLISTEEDTYRKSVYLRELGETYGSNDVALNYYRQAISLVGDNVTENRFMTVFRIGEVYESRGSIEAARELYKQVIFDIDQLSTTLTHDESHLYEELVSRYGRLLNMDMLVLGTPARFVFPDKKPGEGKFEIISIDDVPHE